MHGPSPPQILGRTVLQSPQSPPMHSDKEMSEGAEKLKLASIYEIHKLSYKNFKTWVCAQFCSGSFHIGIQFEPV